MAQRYRTVSDYLAIARLNLQDAVTPYRHDDNTILSALNIGMGEISRIRPDIFLDLKYQRPLRKGDIEDGNPQAYSPADIATNEDGSYNVASGTLVPVPSKYAATLDWFINGWAQFLDVTATQDQRSQVFIMKFRIHLTTLSAA